MESPLVVKGDFKLLLTGKHLHVILKSRNGYIITDKISNKKRTIWYNVNINNFLGGF
jgi:hypothetical protein